MKIAGIIFLCLAAVSLVALFGAASQGSAQGISSMFSSLTMNSVIGGFLLFLANKREKENEEREKWKKGDKN